MLIYGKTTKKIFNIIEFSLNLQKTDKYSS